MIIRIVSLLLLSSHVFGQYNPTDNTYGRNIYDNIINNNNNNNNDQQQQQQQQYGMNADTGSDRRGQFNQIISPYNRTNNNPPFNQGVTIQFQLKGYQNPGSLLPNGLTCVCPPGHKCNQMKGGFYCNFGFSFILSTPDESVRYMSTDFYRLIDGQLPPMNMLDNTKPWDENFIVQLPTKPSAIDIMVHHFGPLLSQADGSIVQVETVSHVDTFVIPLNDVIPAVGGVQSMNQQNQYEGKLLQTKLSLAYSIACTGQLIGPKCDLTCIPSKINSQVAACQSNSTSYFSICTYQGNGQVYNCKNCPWGVKEDTYCQDAEGDVLDPHTAGVVDTGFKTATIVLSILCTILFILFLIIVVVACLLRKGNRQNDKLDKPYNASERPLISSTYRAANQVPSPTQRSEPPSLDAKPIKSALRRPMVPPLNSTLDNTRDTTFSNDVPSRPSRSQIV